MGFQTTHLGVQNKFEFLFIKNKQKKTYGFLKSARTYDLVNLVYVSSSTIALERNYFLSARMVLLVFMELSPLLTEQGCGGDVKAWEHTR